MLKGYDGVITRNIYPGYYQKLAYRGGQVVAVSGYLRKKGKDKKLYEKMV